MSENASNTNKSFLDYLKDIDLTASGSLTDKFKETAIKISKESKLPLKLDGIVGEDDFIHVSFSVKVSHTDGFIPYFHIHLKNDELKAKLVESTSDTIGKNSSNQNVGNYLTLIEELKVKEISFTVKKDEKGDLLFSEENVVGDGNGKVKDWYDKWGNNFIDIFSAMYWEEKFSGNPLFFDIRVFDSDLDGNTLTVILVISNGKNLIEKFHSENSYAIGSLISTIKTCYYINQRERKKIESIKSAKAAIMSRNLSHNLGSHVMSYMKHDLSSVEDMLKKGVLETALSCNSVFEEGTEIPYLVGIGRFLSYLQERQDYIATVSTDYIPYPSIVNFKDAIYDELNPDYRFRRHPEWRGQKPANILLANIAKSEGLSRKEDQDNNNIIIKYGKFDGINHLGDGKDDYERMRQWNFSLPGGIMGRHAIFSIVENVIRNAAKHSHRAEDENLILTFDILDPIEKKEEWKKDSFFKEYIDSEDISDMYVVTLTNSVITDEGKIGDIDKIVTEPFANDGDDLTASNKGLKEMVISAAWLRNIRIEEQDTKKLKLAPILRARSVENHLQYVFCLPKVKEVAIITSDNELLEKSKEDVWKKNGWYAYAIDDYKKLPSKNFNFILLDENISANAEEIRKCSNNRFFVASNETVLNERKVKFDISACKNFDTSEDFSEADKQLFEQLAANQDFEISVYDDPKGAIEEKTSLVKCYSHERNIVDKKYIYRKHNDTETDFLNCLCRLCGGNPDGLSQALKNVKFIEGITGGNSTDRLIRRNKIDEKWAYQHFHAMNTKVAIFDERLFTKISGFEMSQLKEEKGEKIDWGKILEGQDDTNSTRYLIDYDLKNSCFLEFDQVYGKSKEEIIRLATEKYPYTNPVGIGLKRISPLVYHKKGIDVFTWTKIREDKEKTVFAIWGMKHEFKNVAVSIEGEKLTIGEYGVVEKVAELTVDGDKIVITPVGDRVWDYDYVSIHQGLLDKIYEKMARKESAYKLNLTKSIHDKFAKNKTDENVKDYLPGLSIHSGRSKPNKTDMPQHQPFIQYSAIENAISDCKYTLVELLDFACYE